MKTKTDRYKENWAVLAGNELYCYRSKGDQDHRVMHSMIGTFIKEMPKEYLGRVTKSSIHIKSFIFLEKKNRILYNWTFQKAKISSLYKNFYPANFGQHSYHFISKIVA